MLGKHDLQGLSITWEGSPNHCISLPGHTPMTWMIRTGTIPHSKRENQTDSSNHVSWDIYIYISLYYMLIWYEKSVVFLGETNVLNRTPESVAPTESQPKFWFGGVRLSGNGPNAWRLSSIWWGKNHGDPLAQVTMMNWILHFSRQISPQWFWRKYQDVWPMGCQWVMLSLNLSESFWICWKLGFVMFFWKWGTCFLMVTLHISLMAIAEEYTPF